MSEDAPTYAEVGEENIRGYLARHPDNPKDMSARAQTFRALRQIMAGPHTVRTVEEVHSDE